MRRKLCIIIAAIMALALVVVVGCSSVQENKQTKTLSIVTTIFPIYDWATNLTKGTNTEVTMLLDSGVDLHSYQPSVEDLVKIDNCDIFIYIGGESDGWVTDALKTSTNKNQVTINLMEFLGDDVLAETLLEGMEEHEHGEHDEHDEHDEHIWLSLKNAERVCDVITHTLCQVDELYYDTYTTNSKFYKSKLKELDDAYKSVINSASTKTLLFGDRFPFRYLVNDYNLEAYAAFQGCSAESEASFETISFLANKVDELDLKYIMITETSDGKIAETISGATESKNQCIETLNSIQAVTGSDIEAGANYIKLMEDNLSVLSKVLN